MEVILLERIEKLGDMGEVVNVKPGFARNFLLPQNKALRATKQNKAFFESQRAELEQQNRERRDAAEEAAKTLDGLTLTVIRQAGDSGQLYGSVSGRDVTHELREQEYPVEKGMVAIDRPIKEIGIHPVRVALHPEVAVTIEVNVARTTEEAETQLERHKKGLEIVPEEVAEQAAAPVEEEAEAPAAEEYFEEGAVEADELSAAEQEAAEALEEALGEDADTEAELDETREQAARDEAEAAQEDEEKQEGKDKE